MKWPRTPIRYLGIYIGRDHNKCQLNNWTYKIEKIQKLIDSIASSMPELDSVDGLSEDGEIKEGVSLPKTSPVLVNSSIVSTEGKSFQTISKWKIPVWVRK